MDVWPGRSYPLGATYDGSGVNFAMFSEVAGRVELCLLGDETDGGEETRFELTEVDGYVWHAYLPGVQPGQRYGYRVHGPYDPANGQLEPIQPAWSGNAALCPAPIPAPQCASRCATCTCYH